MFLNNNIMWKAVLIVFVVVLIAIFARSWMWYKKLKWFTVVIDPAVGEFPYHAGAAGKNFIAIKNVKYFAAADQSKQWSSEMSAVLNDYIRKNPVHGRIGANIQSALFAKMKGAKNSPENYDGKKMLQFDYAYW